MRVLSPVHGGDRSSSGRGSSPGCGNVTEVAEMPDDGTPRTPRMLRTPRALTSPTSWAFTSELQSVQKSVGKHAYNLRQLESEVCGLQRKLMASSSRIDALEAASCAMAEKPNTPQKHTADRSHDMIVARLDTLAVSTTELEARFEIFRGVMANVVGASASTVDPIKNKLGCVPNVSADDLQLCLANVSNHMKLLENLNEPNVSTDDLQLCLANASKHMKLLENLNDRWKVQQNKDPITAKGGLHLEAPVACAGAGHVRSPLVAALYAATVPVSPPMGVNPLHSVPLLHPLERVRFDDRRLESVPQAQGTTELRSKKELTSANAFVDGTKDSSGTPGDTSFFTREESSECSAILVTHEPSMEADISTGQTTGVFFVTD